MREHRDGVLANLRRRISQRVPPLFRAVQVLRPRFQRVRESKRQIAESDGNRRSSVYVAFVLDAREEQRQVRLAKVHVQRHQSRKRRNSRTSDDRCAFHNFFVPAKLDDNRRVRSDDATETLLVFL